MSKIEQKEERMLELVYQEIQDAIHNGDADSVVGLYDALWIVNRAMVEFQYSEHQPDLQQGDDVWVPAKVYHAFTDGSTAVELKQLQGQDIVVLTKTKDLRLA